MPWIQGLRYSGLVSRLRPMATASTARSCRVVCVALALALGVGVQAKAPAVAVTPSEQEEVGALMGDLMFHADLLSRLDALCPPGPERPARDWQAVVGTLPPSARTPELQRLSKRLSDDAARSIVEASGGCATRHYALAYGATRLDYEALLEQWARLRA